MSLTREVRPASIFPLLGLLLLGLAVFLPGLGSRDLWNPDEPRYAEVAREMVVEGNYLVPHVNGDLYAHKPPLFFWVIAATAKLTGTVDSWTARLPSALAASLCLPLVFLLASALWDRRVGWLSAIIFGSNVAILWQGRVSQIDMLLVLWVMLAVYLWVRGLQSERPVFYLGFFAVCGVATLTKGPVGLLPALLSILVFLLVSGRRREISKLGLGRGLAVWALVVLAWLVPAAIEGGEQYSHELVFSQNVSRAVAGAGTGLTRGHQRPWYHYLKTIAGGFFPWTLLLPAVVLCWRGLRRANEVGALFPLCWVLTTLVFFTLSPGKRSVYVLTLFPALAVLAGAVVVHLTDSWPRRRWWLRAPSVATALLFGGLLITAFFVLPGRPEVVLLGGAGLGWLRLCLALPLAGALVALGISCGRRPAATGNAVLAGSLALAALVLAIGVLPELDHLKSPRQVSAALALRIDGHDEYVMYPGIFPHYPLHTGFFGQVISDDSTLRSYIEQDSYPLIVGRWEDLEKIAEEQGLVVVARGSSRPRSQVLLGRVTPDGESAGTPLGVSARQP